MGRTRRDRPWCHASRFPGVETPGSTHNSQADPLLQESLAASGDAAIDDGLHRQMPDSNYEAGRPGGQTGESRSETVNLARSLSRPTSTARYRELVVCPAFSDTHAG